MLDGKTVAVVVPAYREAQLIGETLRGVPAFVDRVYVIDDASDDGTADAARALGDSRVEVLRHEQNGGVGSGRPHRQSPSPHPLAMACDE